MPIPQIPTPLTSILAAKTYNAAWFSGTSKEAQITNAIASAVADGALYVYVPANMLPYDASLVTFNNSVRMIREGGNANHWDIQAYGAQATTGPDQTVKIQAAINAARDAGGGQVWFPRGAYAVTTLTSYAGIELLGEGSVSIGAASSVELYQGSAAGVILTVNKFGSYAGGRISNIRLSSFGNANNLGGLLVNGVGFMEISNVGAVGTRVYGIRVQGGDVSGDVMFTTLRHCTVDSMPVSTDACYSIFSSGPTSRPDAIKLIDCHTNSNSIWIKIDGNGFFAPDSTVLEHCEFIGNGSIIAYSSNGVNGKVRDCRFETFAGGPLTVNLTPPSGSQPCATFSGNTWAAGGGSLVWNDSGVGATQSSRFDDGSSTNRTGKALRFSEIRFSLLNGGGANITPDCAQGSFQTIRVTNNTAFNVNAPVNPEDGQTLTLDFENASGGALGAITFTAGAGGFRLAGAFVAPANGQHRIYIWKFDSAGNAWREVTRNAADQPV